MKEKIINFGNIVSELENNQLKIVFLKNKGMFLQDRDSNLYQLETYMHGSYLDNLIKNKKMVTFLPIPREISKNIRCWEKEIWEIKDVKDFIKRQKL